MFQRWQLSRVGIKTVRIAEVPFLVVKGETKAVVAVALAEVTVAGVAKVVCAD